MKRPLLFLIIIPFFASAQKAPNPDTLKAQAKADSLKLTTAFNEARKYITALDKKGVDMMKQIIAACEGKTASYAYRFKSDANTGIATLYNNTGNYDLAVSYYNKAIQIGREARLPILEAKANLGLGVVADHRSDYTGSIDKNLLALKYFEPINDTLGIAAATGNIGNSYIRLSQYQKAATMLSRAVDLYTKKGLKVPMANNMANLARAYKLLHNKEKELEFKLKAFAIFNAEGYKRGLATVGGTLGSFYAGEDKFDDAIKYYNIGLKNSWAIHDNGNIAMLYGGMSDLYTRLNQLDKAMLCADSAIYYAVKSGDKFARADAQLSKGVILHLKGDHALGTAFVNAYMALKDSIFADKIQSQVADMEVKYETEKKENQIALLNIDNRNKSLQLKNTLLEVNRKQLQITEQRQALTINELELNNKDAKLLNQQLDADKREANIRALKKQTRIQQLEISNAELKIKQRNYTIAVILALIVAGGLLGYTFYNRYRLKQVAMAQQQKIEQQEQLTQAIIDAEEKERQRIASDLHDGVGQLFSAVKMNLNGLLDRVPITREEDRFLAEKTLALVDESCKEVRVISHQMMPNMLLRSGIASDVKSFIEKIDSESLKVDVEAIGFKNKLESNVEIVLYRVIQETVNNVIKHAKASNLFIKLIRDTAGINAVIADNGIGFNTALKDDFDGIGLKNITTRIEYLKGTVNYQSAPGKGTSVNIWVPIA